MASCLMFGMFGDRSWVHKWREFPSNSYVPRPGYMSHRPQVFLLPACAPESQLASAVASSFAPLCAPSSSSLSPSSSLSKDSLGEPSPSATEDAAVDATSSRSLRKDD